MTFARFRPLIGLCAVVAALAVASTAADARAGRGGSAGSRGSQTHAAPPSTTTAPTARPVERTMTQPGQPGAMAQRPAAAPSAGGFFNRPGFLGGMFAGFLGAGLLGMLMGHGFGGGLGGMASILGLLLQIGLIAIIGYMIWTWWQRRTQPALAGGPSLRDASAMPDPRAAFGLGGGSGAASTARASGTDEVGLTPDDFNVFERILGEVQTAYAAEDLGKLRRLATPELVSYFAEELNGNASTGVVNKVTDVKLLQGDLAEAWREGGTDYATVAMRYGLNDQMIERDSGRVVEGGPTEATEVWTFTRVHGGQWLVSAIQQT